MAQRVIVVPSKIGDVYRLAAVLRHEDKAEVEAMGLDARAGLRSSFRAALFRQTAFVDGELAAMWGLCCNGLSDIGSPYLLTTPAVERVPVQVLKHGRAAVARMLDLTPRLEGHVAASYRGACRLLEAMRFTLEPAVPFGPLATPFHPFWIERRA